MRFFKAKVSDVKETNQGTELTVFIPQRNIREQILRYRAPYRGISAEINIDDERFITSEQRGKLYAMFGDIAKDTGSTKTITKEALKYYFCVDNDLEDFSLSDCSVTMARDFISYVLDFCIEFGIKLRKKGFEYSDDIDRYLYKCIETRTCSVSGEKGAEIHHVDAVGMGANRNKVNNANYRLIALSRKHHTEIHQIGNNAFFQKYKLKGILVKASTLRKLGIHAEDID